MRPGLVSRNGCTQIPAQGKGKLAARWGKRSIFALGLFALLYLVVTLTWGTTVLLAVRYGVMSLTCSFFYFHYRAAAQANEWRIPEGTLLMLGLG